jgi:hypothetical protein
MHRGARIFARRRRSLGREAGPEPQSIGGIQAVAAVTAHMSLSQPIEPVTTRRKPAVCRCVGLTGTSRSPLAKWWTTTAGCFPPNLWGYTCSPGAAPAPVRPSIPRIRTAQKGTTKQIDVGGEPKVRIHFPPAVSPVRTHFWANPIDARGEFYQRQRGQTEAPSDIYPRPCSPAIP